MNDELDPVLQENILWNELLFLNKHKSVIAEITCNDGTENFKGFLKSLNSEYAKFVILEDKIIKNLTIRLDCIDIVNYEIDDE